MKLKDLLIEAELPNEKPLIQAILTLSDWFNVTQTHAFSNKLVSALKIIVDAVGYMPHIGEVYRAFPVKDVKGLEIGKNVEIQTSKSLVQSWSASMEGVLAYRAYMGNEKDIVVVRLLSEGEQLLNMKWVRSSIIRHLRKKESPAMHDALNELASTIRTAGSHDDEDEIIMRFPTLIQKVEILKISPKYKR